MLTCTECGREGSRGFVDGRCTNADQCAKRVAKRERDALADRCVDCLESGDDPKGARKLATKDDGSRQPGPRCVTHHRARRGEIRHAAHSKRIEAAYELTADQYWELYAAQGGKCFVCRKSTGKARRLAVDHDHLLAVEHGHDPKQGCLRCIRALLCKRCNTLVGWLDVEALARAIELLVDPPARKILTTPVVGEPTAIPPTIADTDDEVDPALVAALDMPLTDPDDFWAAEADEPLSWFDPLASFFDVGDGVGSQP